MAPFNGSSPEMQALGKFFRAEGLYTFVRWNTFFTNPPLCITEAELREASRILGVGTLRLLYYTDSGMDGDPASGSLAAAKFSTVADDVRDEIEDLRPDVVVTLDASDGHRDHAVIRDATLVAVDNADHPPAATYLWCLARSSMARMPPKFFEMPETSSTVSVRPSGIRKPGNGRP